MAVLLVRRKSRQATRSGRVEGEGSDRVEAVAGSARRATFLLLDPLMRWCLSGWSWRRTETRQSEKERIRGVPESEPPHLALPPFRAATRDRPGPATRRPDWGLPPRKPQDRQPLPGLRNTSINSGRGALRIVERSNEDLASLESWDHLAKGRAMADGAWSGGCLSSELQGRGWEA